AVLGDVGIVARQLVQHLGRHAPDALRRSEQRSTYGTLALRERVEEGLAIERQRHRPPQLGTVEGRDLAIDDYIALDVRRHQIARRLRYLGLDVLQHRHLKEIER